VEVRPADGCPRCARMRAIADIPAPPTPTRCTRCGTSLQEPHRVMRRSSARLAASVAAPGLETSSARAPRPHPVAPTHARPRHRRPRGTIADDRLDDRIVRDVGSRSSSSRTIAAPGCDERERVAPLMVGGRVRIGDEDRGEAEHRQLSDRGRPARETTRSAAAYASAMSSRKGTTRTSCRRASGSIAGRAPCVERASSWPAVP
jgi:hypothetical protein